ncbi:MAG: MFS transporter [Ruminococcus sp.]|nr:MFS transporter [Candidatus Copronaster equi]
MTEKYTSTKIACYIGYFVQAIINNLAPLFYVIFHNDFNISYTKISWLILINFITQLFTDIASVKITQKLGYRKSVLAAHIFSATGLVLLGILPVTMKNSYIGLIIPIIIYAMGSGLIEVMISPIIEGLPLQNKSGEMSLLHSFYCWGQTAVVLVSTLLLKLIGDSHWSYIPVLWAVVPAVNFFMFLKVPIIPPVADDEESMKISELFRNKIFLVLAVLMLCSGASEISMAQWASTFAENSLGVNKVVGDILGPCMFAVLMGVGRVIFGFIGDKVNIGKILLAGAVLCFVSYVAATLAKNPVVSLISCELCGLSVSTMWPGVLSLGAKSFPKGGTGLFAMLAMFGDFGCAFGPWLAGVMSDVKENIGFISMEPLKFGLLICGIFPLLITFLLIKNRILHGKM